MKRSATLLRAAALAVLVYLPVPALAHDDAGTIRHVLMNMFDRPDARLTVDPVTVEGDIAVAGWAQGGMGGRALMRRMSGSWQIVLCSGDALKEARGLKQFGLDEQQALAMSSAIAKAEAGLDPALVEKFSRFDGIVMMGADGTHPPAGNHQGMSPESRNRFRDNDML